jgi:hypothetical protein
MVFEGPETGDQRCEARVGTAMTWGFIENAADPIV